MNRQQLLTASAFLLATSALTGVANAGSISTIAPGDAATITNGNPTLVTTAVKVANEIFSTTASSANTVGVGPYSYIALLSNTFTSTFGIEIDVSGATFPASASIGKVKLIGAPTAGRTSTTYAGSYNASAGDCSTQVLTSKVLITCATALGTAGFGGATSSYGVGAVVLSMVTLNGASGLATVGGGIALSGTVYNNSAPTQTFESITSGTVVTSAAGLTTTIAAGSNVSANASASPIAFSGLTSDQTYTGVEALSNGTHTTAYSMTLATVHITGSGVYDNTMTTKLSAANVATSMVVTVTSAAITGSATSSIYVPGTSISDSFAKSPTDFVSPYTFSHNTILTDFAINILFNGTTTIPAAAAGTVAIAYGTGGTNAAQAMTATGTTASISQGGFHAEAETVLASGSSTTYSSYIRIHNNAGSSGSVQITVRNDGTGAAMGTVFSTTVPANSTVTLSASQIEGSAGITASPGTNYTIDLAGQITGYIQHVLYNPATGALADMSAFRNNGQASQAP